ncbi:MAG: hypothetical protein QOE22_375 [Candidatus Parcubacteria bacterium]|jgi:uncharacterized membrane protein YhaH (DUF805 family)|nr:hypothetical protein [Candidatus Parcubacteria bacterium]
MHMNWDVVESWNQLQKWILSERLGRRRYVQTVVLTSLLGFALILTPFFIFFALPDFDSDFLTLPIAAVGIAVAILMVLVYCAASVARLRDMGRSTNWFVAGLIPYLNVLFFIVLALTEGKAARDRAARKQKGTDV